MTRQSKLPQSPRSLQVIIVRSEPTPISHPSSSEVPDGGKLRLRAAPPAPSAVAGLVGLVGPLHLGSPEGPRPLPQLEGGGSGDHAVLAACAALGPALPWSRAAVQSKE